MPALRLKRIHFPLPPPPPQDLPFDLIKPGFQHTFTVFILHAPGGDENDLLEMLRSRYKEFGPTALDKMINVKFVFPRPYLRINDRPLGDGKNAQWFDETEVNLFDWSMSASVPRVAATMQGIINLVSYENKVLGIPLTNISMFGFGQGSSVAMTCMLAMGLKQSAFCGYSGKLLFHYRINDFILRHPELASGKDRILAVGQYLRYILRLDYFEPAVPAESFSAPQTFVVAYKMDDSITPLTREYVRQTIDIVGYNIRFAAYRSANAGKTEEQNFMDEFIRTVFERSGR